MKYMSKHCTSKVKHCDLVTNDRTHGQCRDIQIDQNLINAQGILVSDHHIWVTANRRDLVIRYNLSGHRHKYDPYNISFYSETGVLLSDTESPVVRPTGIVINPSI